MPTSLTPLCTALSTSAASAVSSVRDLVVSLPSARHPLAPLSRELGEVQTVAELLVRSSSNSESPDLPARLVDGLRDVVQRTGELVEEVNEALEKDEDEDEGESAARDRTWLETAAGKLAPLGTWMESARVALNLGLDALLLAADSQPAQGEHGLPHYSSSQILEELPGLRSRVSDDADDSEDAHIQSLRSSIGDFLDALQAYVEQQTSGTLGIPSPSGTNNAGSTSASSSHTNNNNTSGIPSYASITNNTPTPTSITLRHVVKKDIARREIIQVAFLKRAASSSSPVIAVSTLDPPTRLYSIQGDVVASLSNAHGAAMTFSNDGRTWAYLSEEDARDMTAWWHGGLSFRKPVVYLADHASGKRMQQMRWPGARPFAFSSSGRWLAVGSSAGRIGVVDVRPGVPLDRAVVISCHTDAVTHAVFTPDGSALVSLSRDGTIRLSDPTTGEALAKLDTDTWKKPLLLGVPPSASETVVVSVWGDVVYRWNYATGALESYVLGGQRSREGWPVALSPDCRFLCCRTDDGVDVSDLHTGRVLHSIRFQSGFVTAAAFSADGRYLALGMAGNTMGVRVTMSTLDVWELVF